MRPEHGTGVPQIADALLENFQAGRGSNLIPALHGAIAGKLPAQPRKRDVDAERVHAVFNLKVIYPDANFSSAGGKPDNGCSERERQQAARRQYNRAHVKNPS